MSDRYDLPRIKPKEEPSIFNHEAGKWGYIAGLGAGLVTIPMAVKAGIKYAADSVLNKGTARALEYSSNMKEIMAIGLGVELAGAAIGGIVGKKKQEQEQVEGRVVKTPGYWNKGIMSGALAAGILQSGYALVSGKVMGTYTTLLMGIGGMIGGSVLRNNQLERDYSSAVQLQQQHQQKQQALIQQLLLEREAGKAATTVSVTNPGTTTVTVPAAPVAKEEAAMVDTGASAPEAPKPTVHKESVQHEEKLETPAMEAAKA